MKVESFKIKSWKEKETGLLISENEDWVLVKYIPVDYLIDGYKLYRKKFIKKRETTEVETQIERVLTLKKVETTAPDTFEFIDDVIAMLKWVEHKYGLFEFQDNDETQLFYGKMNIHRKTKFVMDMVRADGKVQRDYNDEFSTKKIRTITFESDYFESLRLLMNDESN